MYHKIEPQSALPPATQMHFTGRRNTCWKYGKYTCMVCHIRCSTRYGHTMLYQNWMRRIFSYSAILVIIAKETASKLRIVRPSKLRSHDYSPCSRPLCKCADFGAVEPRNLGDFRSNFNGGEILRASLLLSPRLIFSSK